MTLVIGALLSANASTASAQNSMPTNPWYVPPAAPAPTYGHGYAQPSQGYGGYGQTGHAFYGQGYHQPQAYVPPAYVPPTQPNSGYPSHGNYTTSALPQPSLGAGYLPQNPVDREPQRYEAPRPGNAQYSSIDTGAVPGPYSQQPNGYWQRQQAAPQPAYAPPAYAQPSYAPPAYAAAPTYAAPTYAAPMYRAAPQPYGDYPPLGSDPTLTSRHSDRGAIERQPDTTARNTAGNVQPTQRWSSTPPASTDPLLAGPTTLAPYGGGYGAPYGAYGGFAPFPGLPFW